MFALRREVLRRTHRQIASDLEGLSVLWGQTVRVIPVSTVAIKTMEKELKEAFQAWVKWDTALRLEWGESHLQNGLLALPAFQRLPKVLGHKYQG